MDKIVIIIVAIFSAISFLISYYQFKEKGFLFNNAYIWASAKQRQTMNKKPHFRQSAIVFSGIGVLFLLITVEMIVQSGWINYIILVISILLIVFAIISSITIDGKDK